MTGYARALALFALLVGIVVMHSAVFTVGHGGSHGSADGTTHAIAPVAHATALVSHDATASAAYETAAPHGSAAISREIAHTPAPVDHHDVSTAAAAIAGAAPSGAALDAPACPDGDCGPSHGSLHGCVFVLTAIAIALALAVLHWVSPTHRDNTPVRFQWRRIRRARPPPWTVLSLADLAILRI